MLETKFTEREKNINGLKKWAGNMQQSKAAS